MVLLSITCSWCMASCITWLVVALFFYFKNTIPRHHLLHSSAPNPHFYSPIIWNTSLHPLPYASACSCIWFVRCTCACAVKTKIIFKNQHDSTTSCSISTIFVRIPDPLLHTPPHHNVTPQPTWSRWVEQSPCAPWYICTYANFKKNNMNIFYHNIQSHLHIIMICTILHTPQRCIVLGNYCGLCANGCAALLCVQLMLMMKKICKR